MHKYSVTVPITGSIVIEVEAETSEEAEGKAIQKSNKWIEMWQFHEPEDRYVDELHATASVLPTAISDAPLCAINVFSKKLQHGERYDNDR